MEKYITGSRLTGLCGRGDLELVKAAVRGGAMTVINKIGRWSVFLTLGAAFALSTAQDQLSWSAGWEQGAKTAQDNAKPVRRELTETEKRFFDEVQKNYATGNYGFAKDSRSDTRQADRSHRVDPVVGKVTTAQR